MQSVDEVIRLIRGDTDITHYRYVTDGAVMDLTVVTENGTRLGFKLKDHKIQSWCDAANKQGESLAIPPEGLSNMPQEMMNQLTERLFKAIFTP